MSSFNFFSTARRVFSSGIMKKELKNNLRFNWTPVEIKTQSAEIITLSRDMLNKIGSLSVADVTPSSVISALNEMNRKVSVASSSIDFLQHVSSCKDVREASREADKELSDFWVEMSMRTDVFERLCELDVKVDRKEFVLEPEELRFLKDEILDGKRNGLHLGPELRKQVEDIKKRLSKLAIDFSTNIAEDSTSFKFSRSELAGCQPEFVSSLEAVDDKLKVTLQYPHYIPVMRDCTVRSTRRLLEFAYNSRCKEVNLPILSEIVSLRHAKAKVLGYSSHADFITQKRMAKSSKKVDEFLTKIRSKIDSVGIAEKDKGLLRKYRLRVMPEIPESAPFDNYDLGYLKNLVELGEFNVDQVEVQKYFPFEHVTREMLAVYSELLELRFDRVNDQPVWHPDVVCYKVSDSPTGDLVGYFYMDMFPREGKYSHAALFGLQSQLASSNAAAGQIGVCSLVCNFTKSTPERPSLLTHDEVTTYFHEFGHCMHHLCANLPTMSSFAGTNVERDFVECPSQMLENWCWNDEVLKRLSAKHIDTGAEISAELIAQLVKSRNANEGLGAQRQLAFALFDQALHGPEPPSDISRLYTQVYGSVTGFVPTEGTCMPASFGHLCGYDAQYYGYLWAEVFSADMYVSKFKDPKPHAGREYREKVLGPGGATDATDILKNYLGREPEMDAFFTLKGMRNSV